jgi:osmotically-inducible protein OsmY
MPVVSRSTVAPDAAKGQAGQVTRDQHDRDRALTLRVRAELSRSPDVDDSHVRVSVRGSILTLAGTVSTLGERAATKNAAMRVPGIKAVSDQIVVGQAATGIEA